MTSSPLMKKIGDLGAKIEMARAARERAQAAKPVEAGSAVVVAAEASNVVKLPLWPEAVRSIPNGILRSALFGAVAKGTPKYLEVVKIASVEGVDIHYTGPRLDQSDLSVYESLLHALRTHELGTPCHITAYALLKLQGLTDTGKNRTNLAKRIDRLRANAVRITQGRYTYVGGLVDEGYRDEETDKWVIVLNKKLQTLYAADQFTQLDWNVRRSLKNQPVAQWLHGFYATHEKPHPMKMETLLNLAGSENENPRSANQQLLRALDAVADACKQAGQSWTYKVVGNLVHVSKPAKARRPQV